MTTYFDITHQRRIEAAFKNHYSKGVKHPSRILSQHDFIYIVKGEWEIIQEHESYLAREGDVVVLTANTRHSGRKPCADGTETIYIHTDIAEDERINSVFNDEHHIPLKAIIHGNGDEKVYMDFQRIVENYALEKPCKMQRLTILFNTLLIDLYDVELKNNSKTIDMTEKIERYFFDNPQRFFSNSELANYVFLGEKSFIEKFKTITGTTPYQYQILFKMRQIRTALITCPEIKIRELSQNYGFCDEFHLSKMFKKVYGISPTDYRKQFKSNI